MVLAISTKKRDFFQFGPVGCPGAFREGPERCIGRPEELLGGPRETGSGPMGALWESLGSTKDVRGANFDGNPGLILTISFFTVFDFWKAPRGSRERAAEQQEFQRGAQGGAPSSLWGPKGGPRVKNHP